ncbi:hypothetical protein K466DRAFT_154822 [Polyporus arcularius HHB13444]|uniref:Uncharacterized protein n=1 Tax=Polyporus arcularius HHB13444 TaxID=1314778 RepID=A0A5C3PTS8_9APHY|nr:hypothetical protein K466DRAFT_154822 [Polyporus arcularius HHB13444]
MPDLCPRSLISPIGCLSATCMSFRSISISMQLLQERQSLGRVPQAPSPSPSLSRRAVVLPRLFPPAPSQHVAASYHTHQNPPPIRLSTSLDMHVQKLLLGAYEQLRRTVHNAFRARTAGVPAFSTGETSLNKCSPSMPFPPLRRRVSDRRKGDCVGRLCTHFRRSEG